MKKRKRFLAVMMLLALVLSGCGGSDESAADSTPTLSPEIEEALALIRGDNYDPEAVAEPSPTPPSDKKAITIGVCGGGILDEQLIFDINESDLDYRVEVIDYGEMFDDRERAMQQFNIDVATGKGPDIFDLSSMSLNLDNFARKGILEDLNPWLEADEELDRDDFLESIFSLCEVDGGLYGVMSGFSIKTLYCSASTAASLDGWSVKDFYPYADSIGGALLSVESPETLSGESFLSNLCATTLTYFVDFSTGEAYFDSPDFIELLECLKGVEASVLETQPKLRIAAVSNFFDIELQELIMGEELVYVGFPSLGEEGYGSFVNNQENYLAMNAYSENKEDAWDFMRRYLLPEYQTAHYVERGAGFELPTNKNCLETLKQYVQEVHYYTDENGNQQEKARRGSYFDVIEDFSFSLATDEHIQKVVDLIDSVSAMQSWDTTIADIVLDEAGAFFAGDRSAEKAAEMIQSRVKLYLGEQMK